MGFFSYTCAKTGWSIASHHSDAPNLFSECVLVLPDKVLIELNYDGYGRFNGRSIFDLTDVDVNPAKVVLRSEYRGETYHELPPSDSCPFQGFFYDDETLNKMKRYVPANGVYGLIFFLINADLVKFNEAMDYAGYPNGDSYRLDKFYTMQRNPRWWLGSVDERTLYRFNQWLLKNVNGFEKRWLGDDDV